jgi:hypothetical protein
VSLADGTRPRFAGGVSSVAMLGSDIFCRNRMSATLKKLRRHKSSGVICHIPGARDVSGPNLADGELVPYQANRSPTTPAFSAQILSWDVEHRTSRRAVACRNEAAGMMENSSLSRTRQKAR